MLKLTSLIAAMTLAALMAPTAFAAYSDKTFTITNTGNGTLTIAGAGISGNPAEFALLPGHNCTTVAAGGSCAMTVRFTPAGDGSRLAASLDFSSNGSNGSTHSIDLTGTGGASCTAGKQTYAYTGADQNITVPDGCTTATIKAWGAGGGVGNYAAICSGAGGFAQRTVAGLTPGATFVVVVGRGGSGYSASYGGGGAGAPNGGYYGGSGGGLSGVFVESKVQANALVIAGGGGGTYMSYGGGAGGGTSGLAGGAAGGGTQTSGGAGSGGGSGSALQGGNGAPMYAGGGTGGGGGYFGGGGSGWYGGGGGSGYAPGGTLTAGSGSSVANSLDSDYLSGVGNGACAKTASGQHGRVVIIWE